MLNFSSVRRQICALTLALASAHCTWAAGPSCSQLFSDGSWPPPSWETFLRSFPEPASRYPLIERFYPKTSAHQPVYDARFYGLHRYRGLFTRVEREKFKNPAPELNHPESKYEFVETSRRGIERSFLGPIGRFIVVKNKETENIISVPGGFRRAKGVSTQAYIRALNEYLASLEQLAAANHTDQRLDYFFALLDHVGKESPLNPEHAISSEPWRELVAPGLAAKNGRVTDHRVEKVVTDLFDNGDTRRVAVRETYRQENLWVTIIDSHLERRTDSVQTRAHTTVRDMKRGRERRRSWINEVVSVVYPEYVARRKWTPEFIRHDYEEVLASADRTRYIMIRADDGTGKPGPLLASIGLNRAPYGSSIWFEGSKQGWLELPESSGHHFLRDFPGAGFIEQTGSGKDARLSHLPVLKMENYLGVHLERPIAIDTVVWDTAAQAGRGKIGVKAPHFSGEGVIYEPVKFYLAPPSEMRDIAMTQLTAVLAGSIFPSYSHPLFSLHGQRLYTFNPLREGRLLYSKRGYSIDDRYQRVTRDGVEWHVFAQSPGEFLEKFHRLSEADKETAAGEFLLSLQTTARALSHSR